MLRNIFKVCAGTTGLLPRESIPLETISDTDGPLSTGTRCQRGAAMKRP